MFLTIMNLKGRAMENRFKSINIDNTAYDYDNNFSKNIRIERDMMIMNMNVHIVSVFSVQTTLQDAMIKILTRRKEEMTEDCA